MNEPQIEYREESWRYNFVDEHIVEFLTEPENAQVYIDNQLICSTPCRREILEGYHDVIIEKPRYKAVSDRIYFDDSGPLSYELKPLFGWLMIRTWPAGVTLAVDGRIVGYSPKLVEHNPGRAVVEIRDERWMSLVRELDVTDGETIDVNLTPVPRLGGIRVSAADSVGNAIQAKLVIDGEERGNTTWSGELQIGEHEIVVINNDGVIQQGVVFINEKRIEHVDVVFDESDSQVDSVLSDSSYTLDITSNIPCLLSLKRGGDIFAQSESSTNHTFSGIHPGAYRLYARREGYMTRRLDVSLYGFSEKNHNIQTYLLPSESIVRKAAEGKNEKLLQSVNAGHNVLITLIVALTAIPFSIGMLATEKDPWETLGSAILPISLITGGIAGTVLIYMPKFKHYEKAVIDEINREYDEQIENRRQFENRNRDATVTGTADLDSEKNDSE